MRPFHREEGQREQRKVEHIQALLETEDAQGGGGFGDVSLIHNCVPELDLSGVTTSHTFFGHEISAPIIVNAMTGGSEQLTKINRALAQMAARYRLPIAVGSQVAALENPKVRPSFQVVREENPDGVVIANVGAGVPVDYALGAVEMIRADILQVHLNATQELAMQEGDRSFTRWLSRIEEIAQSSPVPVLAKETGSGISFEAARSLMAAGVHSLDVGGYGGTDFVAIEARRASSEPSVLLAGWGIPTVISLVECLEGVGDRIPIVASGGIRSGLDVAKCLALGASACGVAGPFIRAYAQGGSEGLRGVTEAFLSGLKTIMFLVGARNIDALHRSPVIVTGKSAQWLSQRGFDLKPYARRSTDP